MTRLVPLKKKIKIVMVLFCIISTIYFLVTPFLSDNNSSKVEKDFFLDYGWNISIDNASYMEDALLPHNLKINDYSTIDMYTKIPKTAFHIPAISFLLYQRDVWVYVDDELIYEKVFKPSVFNRNLAGTGTVIAILPQDCEGKELHIKTQKVLESDTSPISTVKIIEGGIKANNRINNNPFLVALMVSLMFMGILALLMAFVYRKSGLYIMPMISLALVLISISGWTLCNSRMIEMFVSNWYFSDNLEYISFYMLPLSLLIFIKYTWQDRFKNLEWLLAVMFSFYTLTLLIKLIFGVDFFIFLSTFHILVLIYIVVLIVEVIRQYKYKQYSFRVFCMGLIVLAGTTIIGMVRYYLFYNKESVETTFIIGLVVLSVSLILSLIFSVKEKLDNSYNLITKGNLDAERIRYELLISNTQDIFMDWDLNEDTVYFSKQYEKYFGNKPFEDDVLENMRKTMARIEYSRDIFEVYRLMIQGSQNEALIGSFVNNAGVRCWYEMSLTSTLDSERKPIRIIGILKDITKTKKLEDEYANQSEYLQVNQEFYDNILEADITRDKIIGNNCMILSENLGMMGNDSYNDIIDAISKQLTHEDFKAEYVEKMSSKRILSLYESKVTSFDYECRELAASGEYEWIRLTVRIFKSEITSTVRIISYVKNINEEKKRELELVNNSQIDSLSGLYNKSTVKNTITELLSTHESTGKHAFLMMDIDKFKTVNDTFGHAFGDFVIQEVSGKLKKFFRDSDIVGRIGGDEFGILVKNISDINALTTKCDELCKTLNCTCSLNSKNCGVSISVGVAIYPEHGTNYDELYKNADVALYESKERGRNTFTIYTK